MKCIPKYISSVEIQNQQTQYMKISLGSDKSGTIGVYFGDTSELDQDSNYINEEAFPNSGFIARGKYTMWLSMFTRHMTCDDEDQ
jgi:hypothetical protein